MVLPDAATARVLRTQPEIARAIEAYPRVTKAVVGIGAWQPGLSTVADAVSDSDREQIHAAGVRGELSGVQFDIEGDAVVTSLTDRLIGIDAAHLHAVPEVIAIAYGAPKAEAVRAAIRGGFVDEPRDPQRDGERTARALLMEVLRGGYTNAGRVLRIGDTVRRPWRATSPATGALLEHLERVGFDGAPRFLGADAEGRETLSYIAGDAAIEPHPAWALSDEALVSVASLLRALPRRGGVLRPQRPRLAAVRAGGFRDGTISHNDPNLDNVVFVSRARRGADRLRPREPRLGGLGRGLRRPAVGAAARPGGSARAAARPLARAPAHLRSRRTSCRRATGCRMVDAMVEAHAWCYRIVRGALRNGHEPFERMWRAGGERARRADPRMALRTRSADAQRCG